MHLDLGFDEGSSTEASHKREMFILIGALKEHGPTYQALWKPPGYGMCHLFQSSLS